MIYDTIQWFWCYWPGQDCNDFSISLVYLIIRQVHVGHDIGGPHFANFDCHFRQLGLFGKTAKDISAIPMYM